MVPRFCWLDLRLALSLYSMKGLPVSTCRAVKGKAVHRWVSGVFVAGSRQANWQHSDSSPPAAPLNAHAMHHLPTCDTPFPSRTPPALSSCSITHPPTAGTHLRLQDGKPQLLGLDDLAGAPLSLVLAVQRHKLLAPAVGQARRLVGAEQAPLAVGLRARKGGQRGQDEDWRQLAAYDGGHLRRLGDADVGHTGRLHSVLCALCRQLTSTRSINRSGIHSA
jgi:hypothetical protein